MNSDQIPVAKVDSVVVRQTEDGALILDQDNEKIHQLNSTATYIWNHCDGTHTVNSIATLFSRSFDVSLDIAETDVQTILKNLEALHLIGFK